MKKICLGIFSVFLILTFITGLLINTLAFERIVKDEELSIGIVLKSMDGERELLLKDKFEVLCIKKDIQVRIQNSNNSDLEQSNQIKKLVKGGINVLVVDAVSTRSKELEQSIEYAIDNDVRVVFLENKVEVCANECSYVGFDSVLNTGYDYNKYNKLVEKTIDVCMNLYEGGVNEKVCVTYL